MTCDEHLEATLNRAGQTISDLPTPRDCDYSGPIHDSWQLIRAKREALAYIMDEWRDYDDRPRD